LWLSFDQAVTCKLKSEGCMRIISYEIRGNLQEIGTYYESDGGGLRKLSWLLSCSGTPPSYSND